ncbi:MAG TPA: TonB-dependent receptor [Puia sp.]|uniref:TonB-dependent receptor domain-containing protein n=1 Tax=Puia sp. TaxID=2045100 RepID=UPI002CA65FB7|nr:TonB-dependent receptor [Puia sp.]HVU95424.1 TonB-dependent receptor [Puia sp.]
MKKGLIVILSLSILVAARGQDSPRFHQNLDTATITARRALITSRIDGYTFDAQRLHPAAGETATDLLRSLPGVLLDQQGAPIIRGSGQVKVFINGRPSDIYAATVAEALKLIPAGDIAKIEVITHPSARYDAEGVDAVINIYTKQRQADGVSGSFDGQAANGNSQHLAQLAWRTRRWILDAAASRYAYHYSSNITLDRISPASHLHQAEDFADRTHNEYAGAGLSFLADSLTTLSLHYKYSQGLGKTLIDYRNRLDNAGAPGNPGFPIDSPNNTAGNTWLTHTDNPTTRSFQTLNFDWSGTLPTHSLEYHLLATAFDQRRENDYEQTSTQPTSPSIQTSRNRIINRELAIQADITKHLTPQLTLDAGLKTAFRHFANQNLLTPETTRSDSFYFHRSILAAYTSLTLHTGHWTLRTGARYEQTHWPLHFADTTLTPPDYKNFLPDAAVGYDLSTGQSISAGYSRRLIRPYIDNLNPVVNYVDSLNIEYGNPALRPAISNNYELNYGYRKAAWFINTSLFVRQTVHSIENIHLLQTTGVIAGTYANIADNTTAGLTANIFFQPAKFTLNCTNTLSYVVFNSPGYPRRRGAQLSAGLDCNYTLTSTIHLGGSGYFSTPQINLQGSRTAWRNYSVLIAKTFPHANLSISLKLESLFAHYQYITETSTDETFTQSTRNRYINRFIRIGLTWKFGKKEIRTPTSRTINTDN